MRLAAISTTFAQTPENCRECPPPAARGTRDSTMDVIFRAAPPLRRCLSAKRTVIEMYGREEQGLVLTYRTERGCADTTVSIQDVEAFSMAGIGIGGQPLLIPVYPAREFYLESGVKPVTPGLFEITGLAGYGGSDESTREIGFNSIYYGAELLISPFDLANNLTFAVGGGVSVEGGRTRIPVQGHLRWDIAGAERVETAMDFIPGPCRFRLPTEPATPGPGEEYVEMESFGVRDSTVDLVRQKRITAAPFRPFLFVEGGMIFSTGFDGAGKNPSVNPDEYGEYFLGAGAGLPLTDALTLSLAYRYLRLNLRTPCPTCPPEETNNPDKFFIQNTNRAHTALLKFGLRLW